MPGERVLRARKAPSTNYLLIGKHINDVRRKLLRKLTGHLHDGDGATVVNGGVHDDRPPVAADPEFDREFDLAWARSSPTHELSAHGRSVQRRLDTPVARPVTPSLWKRLRFALYRMRAGR
jgi:hypothetical protein